MNRPVSEDDLHALADGRLEAARRREVEAWLAEHPERAASVENWRDLNARLHAAFDPVLEEPVPARLMEAARPRATPTLRVAAVFAWLALGGVIGFLLRGQLQDFDAGALSAAGSLPRAAALAHAVYVPEVRHPVEVGADQQNHLVAWLSKRLGTQLKPPQLGAQGFNLVGGRLLPGQSGPVAQFMYEDARGQRLTLYVRTHAPGHRETAFRYAQEGRIGVFYWIDGSLGYALSGEIDKADLLRLATTVYQQLNP